MSRSPIPLFAVIIALAALSLPAFAKPNSNSTIKTAFDLATNAKVTSTMLAPGHYNIVVEDNQAKFERDGKTVAEVPCTLKELSAKAKETEFEINTNNYLTEIQVSGKTQAIEFSTT